MIAEMEMIEAASCAGASAHPCNTTARTPFESSSGSTPRAPSPTRALAPQPLESASGHQQRSDNVPAWSGQPHKADLSKNSPLMLLSATSEGPRQITSIGSHCGRTLWAIPLRAHGILQAGRSRPRYESGATGIGKLKNGSRPEAISEVARLRRSLPEPDPENRAAISIRSARPPVIAVIGASPVGAELKCHPSAKLEMTLPRGYPRVFASLRY
jgi:hypothetical protein